MNWHPVQLECAKCKIKCYLRSAFYSADGELMYIFACPRCKNVVSFKTFALELSTKAVALDAKDQPKLLPSPNTSDADEKFLRDLGIEGGL